MPSGGGLLLAAVAMAISMLAAPVTEAAPRDGDKELLDLLRTREKNLAEDWAAKANLSRHQAWAAYRLARRRELGFLGNPAERRNDAAAADLSLAIVQRSLQEAKLYKQELARVQAEREALEGEFAGRAAAKVSGAAEVTMRFRRPITGALVAAPGLRRDPATRAELRQVGAQILTRMNQPVRAIEAGVVRRVARLPQGGFAVVTSHAGGWTSILSGLREVAVAERQSVDAGQILGLAGRTLDGAPVITFELWRNRVPVDPRTILRF